MARALGRALSAGDALGIIDLCEVVDNVYRVVLTGPFAYGAADAADVAVLAQNGALLLGVAGDSDVRVIGHLDDKVLRADAGAGHTACAFLVVDSGNSVPDGYCAEGTGLDAGPEAKAAVGALIGSLAAAETHRSVAVRDTGVVEFFLRREPGALDQGDAAFSLLRFNAHDSRDLFCGLVAAGQAAVCRRLPRGNGGSVGRTAGKAAAAAVCTRQDLDNLLLAFVDGDSEFLRGYSKQKSENGAENAEDDNGINNCHHNFVLLTILSGR